MEISTPSEWNMAIYSVILLWVVLISSHQPVFSGWWIYLGCGLTSDLLPHPPLSIISPDLLISHLACWQVSCLTWTTCHHLHLLVVSRLLWRRYQPTTSISDHLQSPQHITMASSASDSSLPVDASPNVTLTIRLIMQGKVSEDTNNGISKICYIPKFYGGHLYLLPCGQGFKQFMILYGHVLTRSCR